MSAALIEAFYEQLPDQATKDQIDLIERLSRFILMPNRRSAFIIRGYAGTGKTTSIAALVKVLPKVGLNTVLLAPTGRAAKVLMQFSKKDASTIHRKIYRSSRNSNGYINMKLAENKHRDTLFIVDEASMIADRDTAASFSSKARSLLEDLIEYVYSGSNCRIIFIGDIAQLPPVGSDLSPALDPNYLKHEFNLALKGVELKEVLRQAKTSGILYNATQLREEVFCKTPKIKFRLNDFDDIKAINGLELEEALEDAIQEFGVEETIIVTRSNKRANLFNQQFRVRVLQLDEELATGDYIMVVKNNYYWIEDSKETSFIANGDIAEITRINDWEELYGFRFVNAGIRLVDYPNLPPLECKLLIDTIHAESPALSPGQQNELYERVMEDYADIPDRKKKNELLKKNPYFNALQIKFANAITCHKSQGGQWKVVFVDQGYLTEELLDSAFVRWLYTAITRASKKLYLVNFNEQFFE